MPAVAGRPKIADTPSVAPAPAPAFPDPPARKPRKTLAEMAAGDGDRGLICYQCGCRDFRVKETRKQDGYILRVRACRHCGTAKQTTEREAFSGA